ncbi:MAG: Veg family protein [Coriobacteriia bacterium]|nr:Veg family protein [Coriobacteriia bacterium]
METIRPVQAVTRIKGTLEEMKGDFVCIKANLGRSKILERHGRITQIHPSLFVLEVHEKRNRKTHASYQYVDVLTGAVEVLHHETKETLFPWVEYLT